MDGSVEHSACILNEGNTGSTSPKSVAWSGLMTSWLPLPHKQTPNQLNKIMVHGTWTACLVPWGCWPTVCCCWSAGWAPPGTGSTAAVAAAVACSATGWRRDQGCSLGCHSWSLHGEKKNENVNVIFCVFHFFTSLHFFFFIKKPTKFYTPSQLQSKYNLLIKI